MTTFPVEDDVEGVAVVVLAGLHHHRFRNRAAGPPTWHSVGGQNSILIINPTPLWPVVPFNYKKKIFN